MLSLVSPHIGILKFVFKHGSLNMDQSGRRLEVHTLLYLNSGYLVKNAWTNPYKGLRGLSLCSEMVFALGINALIGVISRNTSWRVHGRFKSLLYIFTQCCTCVLCRLLHTRPICDRGPNDMDLVSPHIRQVDSVLVSLYLSLIHISEPTRPY